MRISDCSSDVCSSDLFALDLLAQEQALAALTPAPDAVFADRAIENLVKVALKVNGATRKLEIDSRVVLLSSEERRVGKSVSVRVDLGGRRIIKKSTNHISK